MSITDRYMARVFAFYIMGLLVLLVVILQMLDLLDRSDEIMAAEGASMWNLGLYALLHAPQFLIKFAPFAVLIAMLLSMMQLAVNSEIIALRSTGMAPTRIIKPFILVAFVVAVLHFLFAEFVGVPTNARVTEWKNADYAMSADISNATRQNIWYSFGDQFLHLKSAEWFDDRVTFDEFTLYQVDEDGLVTKKTEAKSATYIDGVWELTNAREILRNQIKQPFVPSMVWKTDLQPVSLLNENTHVEALSLSRLRARIRDKQTAGSSPIREQTSLYARFSSSFANLIMPFLGLFVGMAVPRAGKFALFMAAGLGVGFLFFTMDNMGIAFGNLGILPPFLATFFAPIAFLFGGLLFMFGKEV